MGVIEDIPLLLHFLLKLGPLSQLGDPVLRESGVDIDPRFLVRIFVPVIGITEKPMPLKLPTTTSMSPHRKYVGNMIDILLSPYSITALSSV